MVATLTNIEGRMLKKDEDATVETMLSRMWTAESEKAVTAALIDEYAAAAATAVGPEKAALETLTLTLTITLRLPLPLPLTLTRRRRSWRTSGRGSRSR